MVDIERLHVLLVFMMVFIGSGCRRGESLQTQHCHFQCWLVGRCSIFPLVSSEGEGNDVGSGLFSIVLFLRFSASWPSYLCK